MSMMGRAENGRPRAILDVRAGEWPLALSMCGYFFLVITTFWILKPVKKSLFIQFYDHRPFEFASLSFNAAQAELLAKVLNMGVAFIGVVAFTWLSRRMQRERLTFAFTGFFAAAFVAYALVLVDPDWLTVWSFYLFGDLYSTMMVATFFAFLNDSVPPGAARRLYGLVVLGGVAGGVAGSTLVSRFIEELSSSAWLWACLGIACAIVVLAFVAGNSVAVAFDEEPPEERAEPPAGTSESAALHGARLVASSRYLLSIVVIVGLYEVVSTLMDFQFTSAVSHYLDGPAIGKHFGTVYSITNGVSLFVQLFLTSFLMSRYPLTLSLSALPAAAFAASFSFLLVPTLWVGSMLNTVDNGLAYSLNQSSKEALYTTTSRDEKYGAKAFIDMFVQRFAKAMAVGVSLAVTTVFTAFDSVRWLSLVTAVLTVVWLGAVRYAGREFARKSG